MNDNKETVWEAKSEDVIKAMMQLKSKYGIQAFKAVELFGGDGHTLSNKMAEQSVSFVGYDINPDKEMGFRQNVPNGEFRCGDSVKMMKIIKEGEIGCYNLISTDAPICIYGENYCEHFEILEYTYKLLKQGVKSLCVFPVVPYPYDTEKKENAAWMKRREKFYGTQNINLDLNNVFAIYDELFKKQSLQIHERCFICREYRNHIDWMYEFMYVLEK